MCLGAYLLNPAKVKQAAMDSTNIGNQDSSSALASALQTRNLTVQVRPKLYLLRHAEVCYSLPNSPPIYHSHSNTKKFIEPSKGIQPENQVTQQRHVDKGP